MSSDCDNEAYENYENKSITGDGVATKRKRFPREQSENKKHAAAPEKAPLSPETRRKMDQFKLFTSGSMDLPFAQALQKKMSRKEDGKSMVISTNIGGKRAVYLFNGVYWEQLEVGYDEIKAQIIELQEDYMRDLAEVEDEWEDKKEFAKTMKVILSLQSIGRRKAIVTILIENIVVKGIVWNKNPNLFLFTDHIYSFTEKKYVAPDPDDYMNFTCGYPRGDISNEYEEEQIWLRDSFFYSLFEDKKVTDYILRELSSFLRGRVPGKKRRQEAHFWTGRGANGKSLTINLTKAAFGNYLGHLGMEYFTTSAKSDAPNSQLYNLQNKRVACVAEGGEVEVIGRIFKAYTGGDTISARMTHGSHVLNFAPPPGLFCTNEVSSFSGLEKNMDGDNLPIERRLKILDFPMTFVEDVELAAPGLGKQYRKADGGVDVKLETEEIKLAFIIMLLDNIDISGDKDHQTPYPEQVLEANRKYIASTKHVTNWFNEKMGMATDCFVEEPARIMDVKEELYKSFCENNDGPHKKFAAFKRDLLQIVKRRGDTSRGMYTNGPKDFIQGYAWKTT